jgi:hypothetical protein
MPGGLLYFGDLMFQPITERIGISIDRLVGPGATVSINLTKVPLIGVEGFVLTSKNPTGVIPYGISDSALAGLAKAVEAGDLVLGDNPIRPPKPPTSEDFLQRATEAVGLSDLAGLPKIISSLSREIMIAKLPRRLIHKVYTAMLASEVAGKRREEVVQYLTAMLEKFEGPTEVVEDSLASVNLAVPTREEIQRRLDQVTAEAATNPDI